MIFNNPLIRRYRFSLTRPRQLWIYLIVYISVVALIIYLNYAAYQYREIYKTSIKFFSALCNQFLVLQVFLLWFLSAYNSGSAIINEISGNSYDFFRMLPLSAGKKTTGIIIGKNLIVLLFAAIDFILIFIFAILGQANLSSLLQTIALLLSIALLLNTISLLSSIKPTVKKKQSSIVLLILLFFFISPFFSLLSYISDTDLPISVNSYFYGFELPAKILAGIIAIYFSGWCIAGILRKFNKEDEPLFSRKGAYLFMVLFEFIIFGLMYKYLTETEGENARVLNYSFWLITLLPVLAVPSWSLRSFDAYFEHIGLFQKKPNSKNPMLHMLLYSNLFLGLIIFIIWALCAAGTTQITNLELSDGIYKIFVLFSCYLFLLLLLELFVVYKPTSGKMGMLITFIAAIYILLPMILSGILQSKILFQLSPIGLILSLFPRSYEQTSVSGFILVINSVLCILPALLIIKRYMHILKTRQDMYFNTQSA